ncbi:MAG TPA: class I SAM-dependent methyltransferase [Polyangia bacterium]|nr:class I SAM-dependent methyltransferase [Polyangia bacterium]
MLIVASEEEHRSADFDLDPEVMAALWRMEERHFWHRARNVWIARVLRHYGALAPAKVLEVGCGSGAVAGHLQSLGYSVVGVDTAAPLVRKGHERFPAVTFIVGRAGQVDPTLGPFDVLGFFDVLEHLDDPAALLREALPYARPGALVVATVPALQSLYSVVDALSGHKRRYERGELTDLFARVGLAETVEHGLFRTLRPLMGARRSSSAPPTDPDARRRILIDDTKVPFSPLNALLLTACSAEARIGVGWSKGKNGPTLLAIGRTPS